MDCCPLTSMVNWEDMRIPYKPPSHLSSSPSDISGDHQGSDPMMMANQLGSHYLSVDPYPKLSKRIEEQICYLYASKIKQSKYKLVPLLDVVLQQKHLLSPQQNQLHTVPKDFEPLFNCNFVCTAKLGTYKGPLATLDLEDNARPFQSHPYPVPKAHKAVFKKTLDDMVQ